MDLIFTFYRFFLLFLFPFFCLLSLSAQSGLPDPDFGLNGAVITELSPSYDSGYGLVIQPDGKIIVAGEAANGMSPIDYDIALMRYLPDGTPDPDFGTAGFVRTAVSSGWDLAGSVILQSDGKIVVAGQSNSGSNYDFVAVRYLPDGALDNTFGNGGIALVPIGNSSDYGWACALQPDGKILIAGPVQNGASLDFGVARLKADGNLDNTFGTGGKVITSLGSGDDYSWDVVVQPDGKILAGGRAKVGLTNDFALVRYTPNGELDPSFGFQGKITTSLGAADDGGRSIVLQPDGKILLGGVSWTGASNDFALVRYLPDGNLDISFGSGGIITTAVSEGEDVLWDLALQADGKILAAGYAPGANGNNDFAMVRYHSDGMIDASFGENGIALAPIGDFNDFGIAVALQTDQKIVMAGASVYASYDFAVARFLNPVVSSLADPSANLDQLQLTCSPNPFQEGTQVRFRIPQAGWTSLSIMDLQGRTLHSLLSERLDAGWHEHAVQATGLTPGVYLINLQVNGREKNLKVVFHP